MTNQVTWEELQNTLSVGDKVVGKILRHEPYGVFVDIGYKFEGLIQIIDFKDELGMTPEEYPKTGSEIDAVVLGFKDSHVAEKWRQVWLGVKPSQFDGILWTPRGD